MSSDDKTHECAVPDKGGMTLAAKVSRFETTLVIFVCVIAVLTGLSMHDHPKPFRQIAGPVSAVIFTIMALFFLWHVFRRGVLFSLGPEGIFVRGQTKSPVPWICVRSVEETLDGDSVDSIRLELDESGQSRLIPRPLSGRTPNHLILSGVTYDVSGKDIRNVVSHYVGDRDIHSTGSKAIIFWNIIYAVSEPRAVIVYPIYILFSKTIGKTLDLIGVRGRFLRVVVGFPVVTFYFYGLMLMLYGVKMAAAAFDLSP